MDRNIIKRLVSVIMIFTVVLSLTLIPAFAEDTSEATYKQQLRSAGFPELYLEKLWNIHKVHPNWTFKAYKTDLDWNTAVAQESSNSRNLVYICPDSSASATRLYCSRSYGEYSAKAGFDYDYVIRDGNDSSQKGWVDATPMAVAYYMNPYTFIGNEITILQYESLEWNFSSVNEAEAVIETMLAGTFMSKTRNDRNQNYVTDDGNIQYKNKEGKTVATGDTYAYAICVAAKENNINPCYLTAKILGEVGSSGSGSTSGTNGTYPGRYNYLNVGATDSSSGGAVLNGLKYADSQGWFSPQLAISGGAEFIADGYIKKGQNTSYFQKFNVTKNNTYNHQYMTAVNGVVNTTYNTYKGYKNYNILDSKKTFYIPVFNNMPDGSSSAVTLSGYTNTGVANTTVKIRGNAGWGYTEKGSLQGGKTATVYGGFRDQRVAYDPAYGHDSTYYRMFTPLWYKIDNGYVCEDYLDVSANATLAVGKTLSFKYSLSGGNEKPRFMSWDTRIATVDSSGKITAKKTGKTKIVAYLINGSFAVLNVNVTAATGSTPSSISSSVYSVNGTSSYISKIPAKTTVSTFKSGINERNYIKITRNGAVLGDGSLITTGCKISVMNGNQTVRTYTAIVTGDIDIKNNVGDGKVTITDLLAIRDHLLSSNGILTGVNFKAADVNGDGKATITDLLAIRDYLLGISGITPRSY